LMCTCVQYGQLLSHRRKLSAGLCWHTGEQVRFAKFQASEQVCGRPFIPVLDGGSCLTLSMSTKDFVVRSFSAGYRVTERSQKLANTSLAARKGSLPRIG
jgi:hypothetical protein